MEKTKTQERLETLTTLNSHIIHFDTNIARNKGEEANILHIYTTTWLEIPNVKFKKFNLSNFSFSEPGSEIGFLVLNLIFESKENLMTENIETIERYPINKFLKITKDNYPDFKFNASTFDILVINTSIVSNEIPIDDPTGTKRTVITYEDTDIIDETIL
ncbi:hypothetical protein IMCC3317_08190 [Kordia antarctica]|uniref:Uncharacterized protein n=1 Tax=Kordia antarctica TaxID=1218801 RepID=A0A7L4ZFM4_9FLAO|nr:hypothetical protein [Kordia antarctica]QHI35473.1 hypothetical protein IMCC3317_08190 [Kordia antarctica]